MNNLDDWKMTIIFFFKGPIVASNKGGPKAPNFTHYIDNNGNLDSKTNTSQKWMQRINNGFCIFTCFFFTKGDNIFCIL
jgi:hypothetical protein